MPKGLNEQEKQKLTMLLSDTLPLFHPKHITETSTASNIENKPQGALHRN